MPGAIAAIQRFGAKINFHPHVNFLVTEGGVDQEGLFHKVPRIDDSRLAELFAREVLGFLVHEELLSPEWAERLLSWRHTGFNVHGRVRAKTEKEAEREGKYMIRPLLSLERLSLDERSGQVKASLVPVSLGMVEKELRPLPSKGWAEMIHMAAEPGGEYFS